MDKRALIAIALTFVVLMAWQMLFVSPRQREAVRKRVEVLKEKERADSIAALEGASRDSAIVRDTTRVRSTLVAAEGDTASAFFRAAETGEPAAVVTVTTERLRIELTSRGGEVRSAKLLNFTKRGGEPVELVPAREAGGWAISLRRAGEWMSLSDVEFETVVDGVPVTGASAVEIGAGRDSTMVVFRRAGALGELVEKRFTFHRIGHGAELSVLVRREGELANTEAYALSWDCGLATTESSAKSDLQRFASLGLIGSELYQLKLQKARKPLSQRPEGTILWAAARTKYFLSAIMTDKQNRGSGTLALSADQAKEFVGYSIAYPFRGDPRQIEDRFSCYLGPLDMPAVKAYGVGLERTIDLGKLRFLSVGILKFMMVLKRAIPNYGAIIILLSVLTSVLFYRLTHKSFRAMKDLQRLQPRLKEIQEKYKNDKGKLNTEMMKAYKEAGVNPLGGCLPLLLQMPVFIALYNLLSNTIELRNAPFVGWINDLSSPDILFRWGSPIPVLGSEFHLLPILMGGAMVVQAKLGGSPTGEAAPTAQTKMMNYMLPVVFMFLFYSVPSGLVLYWFVNNILTIAQRYIVQRQIATEDEAKEAADDSNKG